MLNKGIQQNLAAAPIAKYTGSLGLYIAGAKEWFYLSDDRKLLRTQDLTGLSFDEIIEIVGRFKMEHMRAKMPKGKCVIMADGSVQLQHHYTSRVLWKGERV